MYTHDNDIEDDTEKQEKEKKLVQRRVVHFCDRSIDRQSTDRQLAVSRAYKKIPYEPCKSLNSEF